MDYQLLLMKYIDHVESSEGVNFISAGMWYGPSPFTEEEWVELQRLDKIIAGFNNAARKMFENERKN